MGIKSPANTSIDLSATRYVKFGTTNIYNVQFNGTQVWGPLVDGDWSAWSAWSAYSYGAWSAYDSCHLSGGNCIQTRTRTGTRTRTRTCTNPAQAWWGADCTGSANDTETATFEEDLACAASACAGLNANYTINSLGLTGGVYTGFQSSYPWLFVYALNNVAIAPGNPYGWTAAYAMLEKATGKLYVPNAAGAGTGYYQNLNTQYVPFVWNSFSYYGLGAEITEWGVDTLTAGFNAPIVATK